MLPITTMTVGCWTWDLQCSSKYSLVYEVYYQAIVYPENFDTYIEDNKSKFDDDFFSCLDNRRSFFLNAAANHYEFCDEFADPDISRQCYQDNEPAKIMNTLDTINEVINIGTLFNNTFMGSTLIMLKETLGSQDWEQLQKSVVPEYRKFLLCE